MKLSTILVAVVATVVAHSAMAADFYRWVDKNGTTHYTKTPPPKGAKLVGKTETYAVPVYQTVTPVESSSNTSTTAYDVPSSVVTPVSTPRNLAVSYPQIAQPVQQLNQSAVPSYSHQTTPLPAIHEYHGGGH